jgi:hypothetical protein
VGGLGARRRPRDIDKEEEDELTFEALARLEEETS